MTTLLILVRHGETKVNADKKLHKDKDPNVLNENGVRQMRLTAEKIWTYEPDVVLSSKEVRAIESGEIISKICGVDLKMVEGMQERNWGDFSGRSWPKIQSVLQEMTLEERFNYHPPNGESWKEFDERLVSRLDEILQANPNKNIVIVTHGGAIRALMPHLLGVAKEKSFKYDPDNASLTIFEYDKSIFKKVCVNDTSHLKNS